MLQFATLLLFVLNFQVVTEVATVSDMPMTESCIVTEGMMPELVLFLKNISSEWNQLGFCLGLSDGKLEEIGQKCRSEGLNVCMRKVLSAWRNGNNEPAYLDRVANALIAIDQNRLASELSQSMCSHSKHRTDEEPSNIRKSFVDAGIKKLQDKYHDLVESVWKYYYINSDILLYQLKASVANLPVSMKNQCKKLFNHEQQAIIADAKHVDKILVLLSNFWNFFDFELLEHVIIRSKNDMLIQLLSEYNNKFQEFATQVSVLEFSEQWGNTNEPHPGFDTFVTELDMDISETTLWDIVKFKKDIERQYGLSAFALYLGCIRPGSIIITWFIPSVIAMDIVRKAIYDIDVSDVQFPQLYKIRTAYVRSHYGYTMEQMIWIWNYTELYTYNRSRYVLRMYYPFTGFASLCHLHILANKVSLKEPKVQSNISFHITEKIHMLKFFLNCLADLCIIAIFYHYCCLIVMQKPDRQYPIWSIVIGFTFIAFIFFLQIHNHFFPYYRWNYIVIFILLINDIVFRIHFPLNGCVTIIDKGRCINRIATGIDVSAKSTRCWCCSHFSLKSAVLFIYLSFHIVCVLLGFVASPLQDTVFLVFYCLAIYCITNSTAAVLNRTYRINSITQAFNYLLITVLFVISVINLFFIQTSAMARQYLSYGEWIVSSIILFTLAFSERIVDTADRRVADGGKSGHVELSIESGIIDMNRTTAESDINPNSTRYWCSSHCSWPIILKSTAVFIYLSFCIVWALLGFVASPLQETSFLVLYCSAIHCSIYSTAAVLNRRSCRTKSMIQTFYILITVFLFLVGTLFNLFFIQTSAMAMEYLSYGELILSSILLFIFGFSAKRIVDLNTVDRGVADGGKGGHDMTTIESGISINKTAVEFANTTRDQYSRFVSCGANSRRTKAKEILKLLSEVFKSLKGHSGKCAVLLGVVVALFLAVVAGTIFYTRNLNHTTNRLFLEDVHIRTSDLPPNLVNSTMKYGLPTTIHTSFYQQSSSVDYMAPKENLSFYSFESLNFSLLNNSSKNFTCYFSYIIIIRQKSTPAPQYLYIYTLKQQLKSYNITQFRSHRICALMYLTELLQKPFISLLNETIHSWTNDFGGAFNVTVSSIGLLQKQLIIQVSLPYETIHSNEPGLVHTVLPQFSGTLVDVEDEVRVMESMLDKDIAILSITGRISSGKSALAIHLAHKLAAQKKNVHYINLYETEFIDKQHMMTSAFNDFLSWTAWLHRDTVLILDDCDLPGPILHKMLLQIHEISSFKYLKIVVTSRSTPLVSFPKVLWDRTKTFKLKSLSSHSSAKLLQSLTHATTRLSARECNKLVVLIGNSPLAVKITAGLVNHAVSPDISHIIASISKLKDKLRTIPVKSIPKELLPPLWLSYYNYSDTTTQNCARLLSLFPGSFTEETAIQILAYLGFQNPSNCLQNLSKRFILDHYKMEGQTRYLFPRVIKDFFTYLQHTSEHHQNESQHFNNAFREYFSRLLNSSKETAEDQRRDVTLKYDDHNIRYFHSIN